MQIPLEITFHNLDHSAAIESFVREKAARLERFSERITSCRVAIEARHHHRHRGNTFRIRIDLTLPGEEIVVGRDPPEHQAHDDVYVAIRDAFDAAQRRLEDAVREDRLQVKVHAGRIEGHIRMLSPYEGFGFIATGDGREIYFHENSVKEGSFAALEEGDPVLFVEAEEEGEKGPQASAVFARRARRTG